MRSTANKWNIYYNTNKKQNRFAFAAKGAIYYVTIATVIFSQVKITCYFHVWRCHVFAPQLTWYFIGFYITNKVITSAKGCLIFFVTQSGKPSFTKNDITGIRTLPNCVWDFRKWYFKLLLCKLSNVSILNCKIVCVYRLGNRTSRYLAKFKLNFEMEFFTVKEIIL